MSEDESVARAALALSANPLSEEAAQAIRDGARRSGRFSECASAFRRRGEDLLLLKRRRLAVAAFCEAGEVYEEHLQDTSAAVSVYRRILEVDSGNRRALFSLGLALHELGQWNALIEVYRERLHVSHSDGERTTLHLYIAELLSDHLEDEEGAFQEVLKAARLAPKNLRIVTRLEALGTKLGKEEDVAVVLGDLLMHQDDARLRAGLSLRLAELYLGALSDPSRALVHLKSAVADDGGDPETISEMEDTFLERERLSELRKVLEEVTKERRIGPHVARLERELARIFEFEQQDLPRALRALVRAVKYAPEDRELLDEVIALGRRTKDLRQVARAFEWIVERSQNHLLRSYIRFKLATLLEKELGDTEGAREVYARVLREEPGNAQARRKMEELGTGEFS